MIYVVTINNKSYEVEVERGQATLLKTTPVVVPAVAPQPVAQAAAPVAAAPTPTSVASGEQVHAPMPGTIMNIKVTSGASVKKGDILFILEAMKMENEILAPKDGVVAQILAVKGASVSTGDLLGVIQ